MLARRPWGESRASFLNERKTYFKTVAKGQIAPFVGLGTNAGSLYVGELTGLVYKITP